MEPFQTQIQWINQMFDNHQAFCKPKLQWSCYYKVSITDSLTQQKSSVKIKSLEA